MNDSRVSPLCLRIMLLSYCSEKPMEAMDNSMRSKPGEDACKWLAENELVGEDMRATARGIAWVGFILSTPLPEATWSLPKRVDPYTIEWVK